METKYFVDANGVYLGGFQGETAISLVPQDAIEVQSPPSHSGDTWNGGDWTQCLASKNAGILTQIATLEASITVRRMREAFFGTDGGWLKNVDAEISALRATLVK